MDLSSPLDLLAQAQYQDGGIVSQALMGTTAGKIVLFAFDADQELSEHTSTKDAFVHILEGEATVTLEGKVHTLPVGAAMRLPANIPHAVYATTRSKMLLTLIGSTVIGIGT